MQYSVVLFPESFLTFLELSHGDFVMCEFCIKQIIVQRLMIQRFIICIVQ